MQAGATPAHSTGTAMLAASTVVKTSTYCTSERRVP